MTAGECEHCGAEYLRTSTAHRYCSAACRQAASVGRRARSRAEMRWAAVASGASPPARRRVTAYRGIGLLIRCPYCWGWAMPDLVGGRGDQITRACLQCDLVIRVDGDVYD